MHVAIHGILGGNWWAEEGRAFISPPGEGPLLSHDTFSLHIRAGRQNFGADCILHFSHSRQTPVPLPGQAGLVVGKFSFGHFSPSLHHAFGLPSWAFLGLGALPPILLQAASLSCHFTSGRAFSSHILVGTVALRCFPFWKEGILSSVPLSHSPLGRLGGRLSPFS